MLLALVSLLNMRIAIRIDNSINLGLSGGGLPSRFHAPRLSGFQLNNDIPAYNLERLRMPRVAFIKVNSQVFVHRRGGITNVFHAHPNRHLFPFNGCRIRKGDAIGSDAKIRELRDCAIGKPPTTA